MSVKKLQVRGITNELEGASLYFPKLPPSMRLNRKPRASSPPPLPNQPWMHLIGAQIDGTLPTLASMQESTHVSRQDDLIETIRKTVKQVGKEELFIRLTPAEKQDLRAVVYQLNEIYRRNGRKTSDNEVGRIALKFLIEEYRVNGERSILARTQAILNA